VSLALKELLTENQLERRNDGSWLLRYEAFTRLGADAAIATGWQAAEVRRVAAPEPDGGHAQVSPPSRVSSTTSDDVSALRARIEQLRAEHDNEVARTALVLERSRARRAARADEPAA
jgi:uncharacterized protein (DUF1684 family)